MPSPYVVCPKCGGCTCEGPYDLKCVEECRCKDEENKEAPQ